jgi:peptide-methionine (S)-S-oxide reductase
VGFTGGDAPDPTYESVCDQRGAGGHTEAVRVTFDPRVVSYDRILAEFWALAGSRAWTRRPGAQYKAALWVTGDAQRATARAFLAEREREELRPENRECVVEVLEFDAWWDAPERHQRYVEKHREAKRRRARGAERWIDDWTQRGATAEEEPPQSEARSDDSHA